MVLLLEGCLQLEWLQLVRVSSIKSCRDDQSMECFELILKMRFQAMLLLDQFTLVFKVWQPAELEESQQQKLSEVFWSWSLPGCQGEREEDGQSESKAKLSNKELIELQDRLQEASKIANDGEKEARSARSMSEMSLCLMCKTYCQ